MSLAKYASSVSPLIFPCMKECQVVPPACVCLLARSRQEGETRPPHLACAGMQEGKCLRHRSQASACRQMAKPRDRRGPGHIVPCEFRSEARTARVRHDMTGFRLAGRIHLFERCLGLTERARDPGATVLGPSLTGRSQLPMFANHGLVKNMFEWHSAYARDPARMRVGHASHHECSICISNCENRADCRLCVPPWEPLPLRFAALCAESCPTPAPRRLLECHSRALFAT